MSPDTKNPKGRATDDDLDWFTITYRSIYVAIGVVLVAAAVFAYLRYGRSEPSGPPAETKAATPTTTARFRSIEGSVKVKAVGTFEWVSADRAMVLKKSDLVRTGSASAAEIEFFDGTVVHVRPDSLITIEETSEDPSTKQRRVAWHISSGEVNFQTVRHNVPGSSTEVSTPTVRSTVGENAEAAIRVAESGDSDIRLFRGSSRVRTKSGETLDLKSNEALSVSSEGKAAPKVTLPATPVLLSPADDTEITHRELARAFTELSWRSVGEAASYHLMLDYSTLFNRPLYDQRGVTATSQQFRGLEEGRYYWRVAAIGRDGAEGSFSAPARFTVTKPAPAAQGVAPQLSLEALEVRTTILHVKGRTEAGATVTVNGQRIDVQEDGSFNEFITLPRLGSQEVVIRVTGLNGGVAELRRNVVAAY
jgi:hypothetical protein